MGSRGPHHCCDHYLDDKLAGMTWKMENIDVNASCSLATGPELKLQPAIGERKREFLESLLS